MGKIAKLTLGVVYPILCLILGFGTYIATYSDLPNRITIVFDITRVPVVSIPASVFIMIMSVLLIFSVSICIYIAVQKMPFSLTKYENLASHGGFFSAVTAILMGGAAIIHEGLTD